MPVTFMSHTPVVMPSVLNGPAPAPTSMPGPSIPGSVSMPVPMQYMQPLPGSQNAGQGLYGTTGYPTMAGGPTVGYPGAMTATPNPAVLAQDGTLGLVVVVGIFMFLVGAWLGYKLRGTPL